MIESIRDIPTLINMVQTMSGAQIMKRSNGTYSLIGRLRDASRIAMTRESKTKAFTVVNINYRVLTHNLRIRLKVQRLKDAVKTMVVGREGETKGLVTVMITCLLLILNLRI